MDVQMILLLFLFTTTQDLEQRGQTQTHKVPNLDKVSGQH